MVVCEEYLPDITRAPRRDGRLSGMQGISDEVRDSVAKARVLSRWLKSCLVVLLCSS